MKIALIGLSVSGLLLSGCSVMHFKNGETPARGQVHEAWHHNAAYSLLEVSKPVDLKTLCAGKGWSRVTTQETFVTGLAGGVDNALTGIVVPGGIDIWDPQFIQWTCGDETGAPAADAPAIDTSAATP